MIRHRILVKVALAFSVIFLSVAFNLYQYWPGWIDGDGSAMIWEAHYGWFESYLPVVMTTIIRIIFLLTTPSLYPVLIFQLCLACLVLIVVLRWQGMTWPMVLSLAGFIMILPPVSSYAGTIVKDVWFTWAAILATAALVKAVLNSNWPYWTIWVISASLALSFRMDGFSWFLAVILCCAIHLIKERDMPAIARLAISSTLVILIFALIPVMVGKVVPVEKRYPTQQILLFDLAALSLEEGEVLIPDAFNPNSHGLDFLELRFNPGSNMPILNWGQKSRGFSLVHDKEAHDTLKRAWIQAVSRNPGAYIAHRWQVAERFLMGRPEPAGWFWYRYKTSPNVFRETAAQGTGFRETWQKEVLDRGEGTIVNQLWPYLVLLILSCIPGLMGTGKTRLFTVVLATGAISYAVAFAMIAPNVGFRYYYFPVAASVITALNGLAGRFRMASMDYR